ncbi:hypothetical protein DRJ19_03055 [Candidatus Woesearchaeota archaeon]|nr:MAG: hypothetical protein DRJ19_03055 [Candidatus Woesearchaeota archaeon]
MKTLLLEKSISLLKEKGFNVEVFAGFNTCLDIVAKKNNIIYFIKILYNIDALRLETANELMKLSSVFNALPIIIGYKTKNQILRDGIAYERFNIVALSLKTFEEFIHGRNPVAKYFKGKISTVIDHEKLNRARKRFNYSLAELAEKLNISRNALHKYEKGKNPSLQIALQLEKLLKCKLIKGINIAAEFKELNIDNELDDFLLEKLSQYIDLKTFSHAPFKAFSGGTSLLIESSVCKHFERKILKLEKSKRVLETNSLMLVRKCPYKKILSTPILQENELDCINSSEDLLKFIREREENA